MARFRVVATAVHDLSFALAMFLSFVSCCTTPESDKKLTADGGRGRIRTSVARKERQIYSLLVLATHPPVRTGKQSCESNARTRHSFRDTRPIELVKRGIA